MLLKDPYLKIFKILLQSYFKKEEANILLVILDTYSEENECGPSSKILGQ